jgi:NAD-dependent SIR2 family protein deacetylase
MSQLGGSSVKWVCDKCQQTIYGSSISHECIVDITPYCPTCNGCGQEGCCSPLRCNQSSDGLYCSQYLKDLKFGYQMFIKLSTLINDDPKYKNQIDVIYDEVYDEIYKK